MLLRGTQTSRSSDRVLVLAPVAGPIPRRPGRGPGAASSRKGQPPPGATGNAVRGSEERRDYRAATEAG